MDQYVSPSEFPSSTALTDMAFPDGGNPQNPFDFGDGAYQYYALQDQMNWLSGNAGSTFTSGQAYSASSHLPGEVSQDPVHLSQLYSAPSRQAQADESYSTLMPPNDNRVSRSPSTGTDTQMNSSSSSLSRPSSNASSPSNRAPKFKVPMLKTQFENKGRAMTLHSTPLSDGFHIADSDSMTALSGEWLRFNGSDGQQSAHETLSGIEVKASPALLEPFQWHLPTGRRESISSAASGPIFSPFGTPISSVWQHSVSNSPYPMQHGWIPTSDPGHLSISPQSPNRQRRPGSHPLRRPNPYHADGVHHNGHPRYTSASLPSRKSRIARNISDSAVPSSTTASHYTRAQSVDSRARSRVEDPDRMSAYPSQQLALPQFQPQALFLSPDLGGSEFQSSAHLRTPSRIPLPSSNMQTPQTPSQFTPRHAQTSNFATPIYEMPHPYGRTPRSHPLNSTYATPTITPAHQQPLPTPSEPPPSDLLQNASCASSTCDASSSCSYGHPAAGEPIRQSPHFDGDIYTPRYKRRNAAGKWEGWCGYCQPGRWLDLKNSRYWEDKLRNHGICARTKTFFDGPVRVRWLSDRGAIWEGETGDSGFDPVGQDGVTDDGVGRRREGLCGECNKWIPMDGMRSRGRGRCVAWWMHAYKCHEQSKAKTDGSG